MFGRIVFVIIITNKGNNISGTEPDRSAINFKADLDLEWKHFASEGKSKIYKILETFVELKNNFK
jgi:hypothetical protein